MITKANSRSTVHRGVYLDYVGIKRFDAQGNVNGERRFIGLFASSVYTLLRPPAFPWCAKRSRPCWQRTGFAPDSHSGKDIVTILETYPRDELFQMTVEDLHRIVRASCASTTAAGRLFERRPTPTIGSSRAGLPAARPLHHRRAPAHRDGTDGGLQRRVDGLRGSA